jgi:hypothetical protein
MGRKQQRSTASLDGDVFKTDYIKVLNDVDGSIVHTIVLQDECERGEKPGHCAVFTVQKMQTEETQVQLIAGDEDLYE